MFKLFKALDGAHLDRALFGPHVSSPKAGGAHGKAESQDVSGKRSGRRRGKGASEIGKHRRRATRSDSDL